MELELDVCANTFSQAPCTAAGEPCYNTWNTCRDKANFTCATRSLLFSTCRLPQHIGGSNYFPNILSITESPTRLRLGQTITTRGRIDVTLQDAANTDQYLDPYWPRGAIPICPEDMPGTLFGRLFARHKFLENRRVVIHRGFSTKPLCDFRREVYFIDSYSGPDSEGRVQIRLKDPLILAEDKAAQCPTPIDRLAATQVAGNEYRKPFQLGVALDAIDDDPDDDEELLPYAQIGNFLLSENYLAGDPRQDAFFARARHVCVGSEVLEVRGEINNAAPRGWNLRLVARASCGSELKSHDVDAKMVVAETFENMHVADALLRLLLECSEIQDIAVACCEDEPEELIDFDSFEALRCSSPLNYIQKAVICKPVGVTKLMDELSEQFMTFVYWDRKSGKIKAQPLRPPDCNQTVNVIEECSIVGTINMLTPGPQYNQITYYVDPIDCSKPVSKENSGSSITSITGDALNEPCDRRERKSRSAQELISRWITPGNSYIATAMGERKLLMNKCKPAPISLQLLREQADCFELGGFARIHHDMFQSVTGEFSDEYFLITGEVSKEEGCVELTLERVPFDGTLAPCLNCDTDCPTRASIVPPCNGIW